MLLPHCYYLKEGNYMVVVGGIPTYEECAVKCLNCSGAPDTCVSVSGGPKCKGNNRDENTCECNTGFYDNEGKLKDCEACPSTCISCSSATVCTVCDSALNRERNFFNGECSCKEGFRVFEEGGECEKCYMLSDVCVEKCP